MHEVGNVRSLARVDAPEIALRMRVRIDEPRRDDESAHVDGAFRRQVGFRCVADEQDPIAADREVGSAGRSARAVDDRTATKKNVNVLGRRPRCDSNGERTKGYN